MFNQVRVGSIYRYEPVGIDSTAPYLRKIVKGTLVKVVNQFGCPKANTMGHCYIEHALNGEFIGLVCANSLVKLTAEEKKLSRKS
jgi:hypothetical protein